jgi:transglycosylase-like protein with SLT domain
MTDTGFRARLATGAVALFGIAGIGAVAQAELWSGFYRSSSPARPPLTAPAAIDDPACLSAIIEAQARYGIPDNLLLAIGIQEAGRRKENLTVWPWAVNVDGEGMFFRSRTEAVDRVRALKALGKRSIDVGCMQINLKWHGDSFASVEQAFDPAANVDYAARFLLSLYRREGDWWEAAGFYHSSTPARQETYLAALVRNQQVANAEIGQILARVSLEARRLARAQPPRPRLPEPPVLWSSTLGPTANATGAAQFSIYSRRPLTPVLPGFTEMF